MVVLSRGCAVCRKRKIKVRLTPGIEYVDLAFDVQSRYYGPIGSNPFRKVTERMTTV